MDIGYIIQLALFALLALALLVIVIGALRAIPRSHKIKSYRYSKNGDGWILHPKLRPPAAPKPVK